ncbi:MAG: (Fe-S)-binding protein [Thermodesulfobacteriota bacterium]|nr:(Fe-S)-binding protein [Thermodesulfobacteriota bacterium]
MDTLSIIKELEDGLSHCTKCGQCQSVCPLFLETRIESDVARGKLALIEANCAHKLEVTRTLEERLKRCLLCGTCAENCPSGVEVDKLIIQARVVFSKMSGSSVFKWFALKIFLKNPTLFKTTIKLGRWVQRIFFKPYNKESVLLKPRISIGLDKRRVILPLSDLPFISSKPPDIIEKGKAQRKVAFFTGCFINYITPHVGESIVAVLEKNGVEVMVPEDQNCCGIVSAASGDIDTFRSLARRNIELFFRLNVEYIIFGCGTCYHTFKKEYLRLLFEKNGATKCMAECVARRSIDISEYLINVVKVPEVVTQEFLEYGQALPVTFHDPCHLRRSLGVYKETRELVKRIQGVEIREMNFPDRCCGGAGSFGLAYYDVSMEILKKKMDDIRETGAHVVLTSCSGCYNQLIDGVSRVLQDVEIMHPVEFYWKRYQEERIDSERKLQILSNDT